jgi:BirA family biotin operon repressor/biotin-[acetyl-CoA-carboxylase] ligase
MAKKSTAAKSRRTSGRVPAKRTAGASAAASAESTDRQLDALLALLADRPMLVISGAKIAREIGVTRSTVWRWVTTLRALGVHVKGHPRSGYHIERVPDVLVPVLLARSLQGAPHAKRIHHYFKVDSTNRVAMELGQQGEPHGAIVVAEEQSAGRGRTGRTWHSEKSSGIYLTILLRPQLTPVQAPALTLAAGLAARDAIAEQIGAGTGNLKVDLRWPNDVLLNGKKVCGILTEMYAEPDRIKFVVVGFGINVNNTKMPAEISATATSLLIETGRAHSRMELAARLLRRFENYYNQLLNAGPAPIVARFSEVSSYARGRRVRVTAGQAGGKLAGVESFAATTAGLDASGLLRVTRDDGRTETLLAADISEMTNEVAAEAADVAHN